MRHVYQQVACFVRVRAQLPTENGVETRFLLKINPQSTRLFIHFDSSTHVIFHDYINITQTLSILSSSFFFHRVKYLDHLCFGWAVRSIMSDSRAFQKPRILLLNELSGAFVSALIRTGNYTRGTRDSDPYSLWLQDPFLLNRVSFVHSFDMQQKAFGSVSYFH